ncbi:hypothetical protein EVA_10087 [gut metagenome]|uniref:Uncharacterized protein n=1 Tax=gut metagenome TaxID=749906 RepID=J9G3L5_9ZZZZ
MLDFIRKRKRQKNSKQANQTVKKKQRSYNESAPMMDASLT